MLINLSNHSQDFWDETQKQEAIQHYGSVVDFPFPNVRPSASKQDIGQQAKDLVDELVAQFGASSPAFHIMGEMTLTFQIVTLLKELGFTCVASTTERNVAYDNDGTKKVVFKFIQFREY